MLVVLEHHEKIKLHFKISVNILKEKSKKKLHQNKFQMDQPFERTNEAVGVLEENMKEFLMTLGW